MQTQSLRFEILGPLRGWSPAVNVHASAAGYIVCAELAGVDLMSLRVLAGPRQLVIRGDRPPRQPEGEGALRMLALEIDYGPFERVIVFPQEIDSTEMSVRHDNGLVWIRLPFLAQA